MRILFFEFSEVWDHLLPWGFRQAGHEVRVSGDLEEAGIPVIIDEYKPDLIITMGWGKFQWSNYQEWLSKYIHAANIPHVFWSLEDPEHTHIFTLPLLYKVKPDFVFTICASKVEYFNKMGFKTAHMDYGYNPSIHFPMEQKLETIYPIAVVASSYEHILSKNPSAYRLQGLKTLLCPLIENGIRVDFWGYNWDKMKSVLGYEIPSEWIHGYLPYLETNRIYNSSGIILGLQNNYSQLTQRTYEVLGSGAFLLSSDTYAVREFLKPGVDLVVSSSPKETLDIVEYYLQNPKKRKVISEQGNKTIADHTYTRRAEFIINTLKEQGILK